MVVTCEGCGATKEVKTNRLPRGWKRDGESTYCADCWRDRSVLRAIAMPIAEPMDATWKEVDAALKAMWGATTQASNWMMTELYARDVRRADQAKLPPMERVYLYPEARKRFPALPSVTVATLENIIQAKYRAVRYQVIWTCGMSLPSFRFPTPLPLPNQSWSVELVNDRPTISVRLGERRFLLRLKTGSQFHRQLLAMRQIASGQAQQGQLDIYRRGKAIMVKMVAYLPRGPQRTLEGTLRVMAKPNSLLVAVNAKDEALWTYNADHLRRWSAEHRKQLDRWSDDSKFEQRPVPAFADRRRAAAIKYRDRMNSAVREIAASLAGYAVRRKFAAVQYDDSDRSYCEAFPWADLKSRIETKLEESRITFVASGPGEEVLAGSLAEGKSE